MVVDTLHMEVGTLRMEDISRIHHMAMAVTEAIIHTSPMAMAATATVAALVGVALGSEISNSLAEQTQHLLCVFVSAICDPTLELSIKTVDNYANYNVSFSGYKKVDVFL
ncbi:hypothetical protein OESDEN_04198 [Oesophagostomum dentatum]|uniref:Uncharacterized protein n=1 Tax=Oesophagostomum dentatum TaxID=61180 RepID=A0A0B1TE59_OESDE|nr:hypothetical protein OESDEN_04198 [Oesophagostomum dentatum]